MIKKGINLSVRYISDLKQANKDIKKFRKLHSSSKKAITIPVRLDMSSIKAQSKEAGKIIQSSINSAITGTRLNSGTSKDSLINTANSTKQLQRFSQDASAILRSTQTTFEGSGKKIDTVLSQVGRGITNLKTITTGGDGEDSIVNKKTIDNVQKLKDGINSINKSSGRKIAAAEGLGDSNKEMQALIGKADKYKNVLESARRENLQNSQEYIKSERSLDRLNDKITRLSSSRKSGKISDSLKKSSAEFEKPLAIAKASSISKEIDVLNNKAERYRKIITSASQNGLGNTKNFKAAEQALASINNRLTTLNTRSGKQAQTRTADQLLARQQNRLKNQIDINKGELAAAKAESNKLTRAQKVNQVYSQRAELIKNANRVLSRLESSALRRGRGDIADRARTQIDTNNRAFSQDKLDQKRFNVNENKGATEARLKRRIQFNERFLKLQLASLAQEERRAQKLNVQSDREAKINQILQRRAALYGRIGDRINRIEATARTSGLGNVANQAAASRNRIQVGAINSTERLAKATATSQRNLDFHSSSLVKNAKSIVRWMVPLAIVQGTLAAFNSGVQGVINTERQFATLQAVYRGTAAEARLLRDETIALAIAQGRSTDEALDATIRFARLGLTRQQTARLTETSLIAANVAEIAAGEAAEKLSSIYASYNLTVTETVLVLDQLNAISNTYNTTNKDLLDGIARSGGTARQAGLDLAELAGVIGSLVGATGRSGSEAGNALNFIITRIRKASNIKSLQETFDVDLTETNGEIKEFDEVLRILSTRYASLTGSQKDLLVEMAAGARQANRFRLTLENYSQAQILTARANLDTNSALKENDKILNTVSASVEALKAAWTELFISFEDSGAFDFAKDALSSLSRFIRGLSTDIDDLIEKTDKLNSNTGSKTKVSDNSSVILNYDNFFNAGGSEFTEEEIQKRINKLQEIINLREKGLDSRDTNFLTQTYTDKFFGDDVRSSFNALTNETLQDFITTLNKELIKIDSEAAKSEIESIATVMAQTRKRIIGLGKSSKIFSNLAEDIQSGNFETEKLTKTFVNASQEIFALDKGTEIYSKTLGAFLTAMQSSDTKEAISIAQKISEAFNSQQTSEKNTFITNQNREVNRLNSEIEKANINLSTLSDNFNDKELQRKTQDLQDQIKTLKEQRDTINEGFDKKTPESLSVDFKETLKEYLEGSTTAAKELSATLTELSKGDAGTPERTRKLSLASLQQESNLLDETLSKTKAKAKAILDEKEAILKADKERLGLAISDREMRSKSPFQSGFDKEKDNDVMNIEKEKKALDDKFSTESKLQNDYISIIDRQIKSQPKANEERRKEIDRALRKAQIEKSFQNGATAASNSAGAFLTGANDSEQKINQSNALLNRNKNNLQDLSTSQQINELANSRGKFLTDEATIKANINTLDMRAYSIQAERKNNEIKLTEELQKQVEARSKSLSLASREDQLRAAATAGAIQNRGSALTRDEFSFLSQPTRQNINSFNPNAAPGLNDTQIDFNKNRVKLDNEANAITNSLARLRERLDKQAEDYNNKIKALDSSQLGINTQSAQDAAKGNQPVINLDFKTNIDVNIKEGLIDLRDSLIPTFKNIVKAEISNLRTELGSSPITPATDLN